MCVDLHYEWKYKVIFVSVVSITQKLNDFKYIKEALKKQKLDS